jgi:hypothetical protein
MGTHTPREQCRKHAKKIFFRHFSKRTTFLFCLQEVIVQPLLQKQHQRLWQRESLLASKSFRTLSDGRQSELPSGKTV